MNTLAYIFFVIFFTLHLVLMAGLFLEVRRDRRIQKTSLQITPSVSVIIPFHNEEDRIKPLLESLMAQDYPSIQLVFVDDCSTDNTVSLLKEFSERFIREEHTSRIISLEDNPRPNRKQFALSRGFMDVAGELILLTDADCELPETWVSGMVRRMSRPNRGVVIGPVFKKIPGHSLLYKTEAFDHGVRYMYLAASIGLGSASGGFGNNMIVRKSALEAVGGYAAVPSSPTEDAAMISVIKSKTPFQVRAAFGPEIQVMTETEKSWQRFIGQTLRWTKGGIFSPDLGTRLSFSFLMGMISLGILAIPFLVLVPALWPLPLSVYSAMLMNTLAVLWISKGALRGLNLLDILVQFLVTPVINSLLTIMAFLRVSVYWKGKKV